MGKKILVADDSPTIRKLAESLLKKEGYQVLCAEEGASALELSKTNQPDLILWDDSLPLIDGHHICEQLKRDDQLKRTPLIILLDQDQVGKQEELKRMGADAFMVKPLTPRDILEKVRELLGEENAISKDKTRKESKDELVPLKEKLGIGKTEEISSLSKKDEKAEESLDILETSDFLESLETSSYESDTKEPHGFDWLMSELKREMDKNGREAKEEIVPTKISSLEQKQSKKKEDDKAEEFLIQKIPSYDSDKLIQELIEKISTKIAQEVAKKIDPEILKQTIRAEVEKFKKSEIKTR